MKKIYLLALLLLTISLTICKADDFQQGYVILKNGKRVGGYIKLYKYAPWKNQRYIWFKDSAAVAADPGIKPKKLYAKDLKFFQAGTRQFVKVSYFDQAFIKARNFYSNSWMLERVSNGRFVAYMFYSSPPEFFDYFFADPHGDQTEPVGNENAMLKYRIIFKKDTAKHFVNAYSYNLAKYFKDTPQILEKYQDGKYGNQPDVDGSMFERLSMLCNRTIFTSHEETTGIIAAFNDYNQVYAPKIETPAPTPAQATASLFKPYWFKGNVIDNDTHKGVTGAAVSYIDSATQQVVKATTSDSTGAYSFYVTDAKPFGIKVEKPGFFTQNLTGEDASNGKALAVNANGITTTGFGNGSNSGSGFGGNAAGSGSASFAANASNGAGNNGTANAGGVSSNGNGSDGAASSTSSADATATTLSTTGALTGIGASGKPLSAKYMKYIHSARYKHSIYYKQHLQYERELAQQKASTDASTKNGTLAGNPATGSAASANGTDGSATGTAGASALAGGSAPVVNASTTNNGSANGSNSSFANDGSAANGGISSQALAVSGKITDGKFISPDIRLQSYSVNKPIVVNNILYDYGYATLRPESVTVLDGLVKTMIDNPSIIVELSAHTDSVGSDAYNLKLSQDRAQTCVSYIVSKGIEAARINAVGYGKSKPIAPNTLPNGQDNPDGRQLNRRIEFVVKKNEKAISELTSR